MSAGRGERRRHEREERRTFLALRSEGVYESASAAGRMPTKQPGQHRWIATAMFTISNETARAMHDGGAEGQLLLDRENLTSILVGCIDCEEPFIVARDRPCPAGDEWS